MSNSSIRQAGSAFGRICVAFAATSALILTTSSPVIAHPSQTTSPSPSVESPAEPQNPDVPVDDRQQAVAKNDDPAAVVEDLPPIAPETSLPAAPPPDDADTRSDGSEPVSEVPTARSQARTAQTDQEWEPTEDPNATVVPGQMRSDREEIPEGFTKEDADKAETMEARLEGAGGGLRALVAPGCQVYWPAPYEVCGAIRDKYNALGGPNSFLLFPKTGELTNPDGVGKRTEFINGPIYWSPQGGAHPVVNHFLAAWARHGYEASYIGYPTTDEIVNPDGIGRRQHFNGSTIYWRLNEAYSVGGAIQDKWNSLGAERGQLGYPTSDERVLPDGQGRMNRFENGAIYWHPKMGARHLGGTILDRWETFGFETGKYGYPLSDPVRSDGIWHVQHFEGGQLEGTDSHRDPLVRQYVDGKEVAWNYEKTVLPCLEFTYPGSSSIAAFPTRNSRTGNNLVRLSCETFRTHIVSVPSLNGHFYRFPTSKDWLDFMSCVYHTLNAEDAAPGFANPPNWARTRGNSYTNTGSAVIVSPSDYIVTAWAGGPPQSGDWSQCRSRLP